MGQGSPDPQMFPMVMKQMAKPSSFPLPQPPGLPRAVTWKPILSLAPDPQGIFWRYMSSFTPAGFHVVAARSH